MTHFVKRIIKQSSLYFRLRNWLNNRRQAKDLIEWENKGRPVPPPHLVKQRVLREHAKRHGLRILVETGTYYGDMVEAQKRIFDNIYSIELSRDLYENARKRFQGQKHIEIIHGDSGKELAHLMNRIDHPALFWLDGHYSAGETARGSSDTPIYEELHHILGGTDRGHVIIIDDARCFGSIPGYPSIDELTQFIKARTLDIDIRIENDSIRIVPRRQQPAKVVAGEPR